MLKDALVARAKEGIFGYSEVQTPYFEIIKLDEAPPQLGIRGGLADQNPQALFFCPGDGKISIHAAGDSVLIQLPVYYPFSRSYSGQ